MRFCPESGNRLYLEHLNPWDTNPWFKPVPDPYEKIRKEIKRKRKENGEEQVFPTLYTHYRLIDFSKFNDVEPKKKKGGSKKKKNKKGKAAKAAKDMPKFECKKDAPQEVLLDRNTWEAPLKRDRGVVFIRLTMPHPVGFVGERVHRPLAYKDVPKDEGDFPPSKGKKAKK